jgi:hypothetical protein
MVLPILGEKRSKIIILLATLVVALVICSIGGYFIFRRDDLSSPDQRDRIEPGPPTIYKRLEDKIFSSADPPNFTSEELQELKHLAELEDGDPILRDNPILQTIKKLSEDLERANEACKAGKLDERSLNKKQKRSIYKSISRQ